MSDPRWYSKLPRWQRSVVDQSAHLAVGLSISLLSGALLLTRLRAWLAALLGGALGVLAGVLREVIQNVGDTDNRVWDSVLDASVWGIGGALGALAVWFAGRRFARER